MEPRIPTAAAPVHLVRLSEHLEHATWPRSTMGALLTLWGGSALAYALLGVSWGAPLWSAWVLVHLGFAGVLIGIGGALSIAAFGRWTGRGGIATLAEKVAWGATAVVVGGAAGLQAWWWLTGL